MLSFPNHDQAAPLDWISHDVGSYITLRWRLADAFEHSKSLVDDLASAAVFEDVLASIEKDPNGPQVNLRSAIIQHLGERVTVFSEPLAATTVDGKPQGGRTAGIAFEITDSSSVKLSLAKIMMSDPVVRRVDHGDHVLWVMTTDEGESDAEELGGFGSFASEDDFEDEEFEEEGPKWFPQSHLLCGP